MSGGVTMRVTRSRTRRLLLQQDRISGEPSQEDPSPAAGGPVVDMNNNVVVDTGNVISKISQIHSSNGSRPSASSTPQDFDPIQHQEHHSSRWTFLRVCNKLLSFPASALTHPRLKWSSPRLPRLLTLVLVFILFVVLSFLCTNRGPGLGVGAVCVWQGGGGFRLACGFRQSGLFRLRSLGGLKGWAGAGFTIGDEDGFKDSLSNVDPQSQQRLGKAAAGGAGAKAKGAAAAKARVGRYAGQFVDPRYQAMLQQQQQQQYYGAYAPRAVGIGVAPPTAAPKKSMWENWKWPSLLKKKSSSSSSANAAGPVRFPVPMAHPHGHAPAPVPVLNGMTQRYGYAPAPAPGYVPIPMPVPITQQQQQAAMMAHYQQQQIHLASQSHGLLQQRQGAAAAPALPTIPPNFPSFAPMPDFPALDDEEPEAAATATESKAPATQKPTKPARKPYGLELLEKSPNFGKKYKIRPPTAEEMENTLTSPSGPLGYDTDIFPDIYITTTNKNAVKPLDLDHTTEKLRKMKLKKIKLLKKGHAKEFMRQKLFNATTPADELAEFTTPATMVSKSKLKLTKHHPKQGKLFQQEVTTSRTTTTTAGEEEEDEEAPVPQIPEEEPAKKTKTRTKIAPSNSKSKPKKPSQSHPKNKGKSVPKAKGTPKPVLTSLDDEQEEVAPEWQQYSPTKAPPVTPPRPRIPTPPPHPRNTEPPLRPDYGEEMEYQARKTVTGTSYGHSNHLKIRPSQLDPELEYLPTRRRPATPAMPPSPFEDPHEAPDAYQQNLHRLYSEAWEYLRTSTPATTEAPPAPVPFADYDYNSGGSVGYTHPRTVKVYDPRFPPNHEVNRGAMLPSSAAGRYQFVSPATRSSVSVSTTEFPFYAKSAHFHPQTHFSRKSNSPHELSEAELKFLSSSVKTTMTAALNDDVGSYVRFDSSEAGQFMNYTRAHNSKFYSHYNKSAPSATRQNSFSSRGGTVYPLMNNYDYYGNAATPSSRPAPAWPHSQSHHWQGQAAASHERKDSLEERLRLPRPPTTAAHSYWRDSAGAAGAGNGLWISQTHSDDLRDISRLGHGPIAEFVTDKTFRVKQQPSSGHNSVEEEFPTNSNRKVQFVNSDQYSSSSSGESRRKSGPTLPTASPTPSAALFSSTPSFQDWKGYVESVGSTVASERLRDKDLYAGGSTLAPVTATPRSGTKPPAVLRRRPPLHSSSSTTEIPYHQDAQDPETFMNTHIHDHFDAYDQQLVSPRPGSHRFPVFGPSSPRPHGGAGEDEYETSTERKNKFKIIVIDNIENEQQKQDLVAHFSSTAAPFLATPSTMIFDVTGGAATGRSPISSSTARPFASSSSSTARADDDWHSSSTFSSTNLIDGDAMDPIENLHKEIKKLTAQSNSVLNDYLSDYATASSTPSSKHVVDLEAEAAHRRRLEQFEALKQKFEEQQAELARLRGFTGSGSSTTRPRGVPSSSQRYDSAERVPSSTTRRTDQDRRHTGSSTISTLLDEIIMEDYASRRPYNATAPGKRIPGRRKSTTYQPVTISSHDVDKSVSVAPMPSGPLPVPSGSLLPPGLGSIKPHIPDTLLGPPRLPIDFPMSHLNEYDNPNKVETDWELYSVSGVRPQPPVGHDFKTLVEINAEQDDDDELLASPSMPSITAATFSRTSLRNSSPIQPSSYFSTTPSFSGSPSPSPSPSSTTRTSVAPVRHMHPGSTPVPRPPAPTPQVMIREDGSVSFSSSMRPKPTLPFKPPKRKKLIRVSPTPSPSPSTAPEFDEEEEPEEESGHFENSSPSWIHHGHEGPNRRKGDIETKPKSERENILKALETLSQAKSEMVESIVSEKFGGELPGEVIKIVPSLPSHLQKLTTTTTTATEAPIPVTSFTAPPPRKRINPPSPTPNLIQSEDPAKSSKPVMKTVVDDIKIPASLGDNVHVIELDIPDAKAESQLTGPSSTLQSMIASALEKFHKDENTRSSTGRPMPAPVHRVSSTGAPSPTPVMSSTTPRPAPSPTPTAARPRPSPSPSPSAPSAPGTAPGQQQHPLAAKLAQMGLLEKLNANNLTTTQVQTIRKLIKLHQIEQKVDNMFTTTTSTTPRPRAHPTMPGQVVFSSPSSPYEIIKVDDNMDLNRLLGNLLQQQSTKVVNKVHSHSHQAPPPTPVAAASSTQNRIMPMSPSMMSFVGNLNNLASQQMQMQQQQQHPQQQISSQQLAHRIVNLGAAAKNQLNAAAQFQQALPTIAAHALHNGLIQIQKPQQQHGGMQMQLPQMIHVPQGTQGQSLQELINQQIHQQQAQAHILNNPTLKALQALALNRAQNVRPSPQILFPQQVAPGGEPVFVGDGGMESAASEHHHGQYGAAVGGTAAPDDYVDLSALIGLGGPSAPPPLLKRNAKLPIQRITHIRPAPKSYHPSRDAGFIGSLEPSFDPHAPREIYTTFQCQDQKYFPGLYADTSNSCEVFHLCAKTETGFMMKTFRCPQSTVFDQEVLRCNWNLYVDCPNAQSKYYFNKYVSQSFQFLKSLGEFSASYQQV